MKTTMAAMVGMAALALSAAGHPAAAQSSLGAVVCVGGELETVPGSSPVRRVYRSDQEVTYRVGVELANLDEVEGNLRSQLDGWAEVWCARSGADDGHVAIVRFTGVLRLDLTLDEDDLRFQAFAVGYGANPEAAEAAATLLNDRFRTYQDGSGHEVLVREEWSVGAATTQSSADSAQPSSPQSSGQAAAPRALRQSGETFRDSLRSGGSGPEMVVIPSGSFRMGCVSGVACNDSEFPVHDVTIPLPFAVGKFEVTFLEWDACVSAGGCGHRPDDEGWGRGNRPVINVSWEDAQEYVRWLSSETGAEYRLLSEAEWEYAARAGSSTAYSWGNDSSQQCGWANGPDLTAKAEEPVWEVAECRDGYLRTAPVGSFGANAFGLHDIHGNVSEWVEDCWNNSYNSAPSNGSAWRSGFCSGRISRGGSSFGLPVLLWQDTGQHVENSYYATTLRSAGRNLAPSLQRDGSIGFRVARTLTP